MPKLAVCWIWQSPFVWTRSVESMLQLHRPEGLDVQFLRGTGWGPARRHTDACEKALAWGADYLLILGADQVYEPDLLDRLWARAQEGYEIVAALVPTRGYISDQKMHPFQPVAWRLKPTGLTPVDWDRGLVEIIDPADGDMQRIDLCGSGVLLFHRDHLLALDRPWFSEAIDHDTQQRTASMDTRFVWRLRREAYAQVWVDTTIKVKHLHVFEIDESFGGRFADWARPGAGDPDVCQFEAKAETPLLEAVT